MRGRPSQRWLGLLGTLGVVLVLGAAPPAADGDLRVTLECQPRAAPGRVLCEAELRVADGRLEWADVLVLAAPDFAPPLRARVVALGMEQPASQRQRVQLALAGTRAGSGWLRVRGRAVYCPSDSGRSCQAVLRETEALVQVGPPST